jgi:Domain of unknown function (DUF3846)
MKMNKKYEYEDLMKMAFEVVKKAEVDAEINPTSDLIQVVIVKPSRKPYKDTIPNTLDAFNKIVGGYIENLFFGQTEKGARLGIVLNEEGKILDLPFNRRILGSRGLMEITCGTFFITAYNLKGENISLTNEEAEKWIRRFTGLDVYV